MRIFLIDMVGRHSVEARILKSKLYEDAEHYVVSWGIKCMTFSVIFMFNVYMIFMIMLYGANKGLEWQKAWLVTTVINVLIDVFFNYVIN